MNVKKLFLWYFMLTKRLFRKWSFLVLLCCIPLMVLASNYAMSGESGVMTIFLCCEDDSPQAHKIVDSLFEGDSVIRFKVNNNKEEAIAEVKNQKADAVWCFESDFEQKTEQYAKRESLKPLVTVYQREDNIPLQLSNEILYGALYSSFSYEVYENFVYTKLVDKNTVSEEDLARYFNHTKQRDDIVKFEKTDEEVSKNTLYLLTPLRGIMSIMVVLCGLAAAMYFLKDKKEGKYNWMSERKKIIPAFAQCLAALVPGAIAVLLAIGFTHISVGFARELLSMLLFVIASSGFCLVMCMLFKKSGNLGAVIPAILVVMLAVSPVFITIDMLKPIGMLMPVYYYLNSIYNASYYLYFVYYIIGVYAVAAAINSLLNRR